MSGQAHINKANAIPPSKGKSEHLQIPPVMTSQKEPGSEESDWVSSDEEETDPEYLSSVDKINAGGKMKGLGKYSVGSQVYLKLAKNKREAYTISAVHKNQTYDLKDGPGGKTKSGVKQRDLE